MLKLGNNNISKLFLGSQAISKAYLGNDLVWQAVKPLPYDAEVEYLESTGTQYIEVGSIIGATSISIMVSATEIPSSGATKFYGIGYNANFQDDFGVTAAGWGGDTSLPCTIGKSILFEANGNGLFIDGTQVSTSKYFINSVPLGKKVFLFCGSSGTNAYITSSGNYMAWRGRIYSCKIMSGTSVMFDFIPVRVGGVGYMYDRVSKQLFGNQGSGNFIVGPDVVEVEYLESTGTQYILLNEYVDGFDGLLLPANSNSQGLVGVWNGGSRADAIKYTTTQNRGWVVTNGQNSSPVYSMNMHDSSMLNVSVIGTSVKIGSDEFSMGSAWGNYFSKKGWGLFGNFNVNTDSFDALAGRLGACKLYYQGVNIHDMVPVRVGMEGAMMDRLTRKIYRNAGTGAFKFGADRKETPLMCNSYVKDGLVAMWDGVENAGWGTHDASATVWKDLTGNHVLSYEFTPSFTDNAFELPGTDKVAYCESNLWRDAVNADQCTVEICFKGYSVGGNNSIIALSRGTTSNVERAWWQWGNVAFGYRLSTGSTWSNDTLLPRGETGDVSLSFPLADMYMNGTKAMTGSPGTLNIQSNTLVIGRIGSFKSTINEFVTMRADIHSIRIYNKVLTADEIAANYEIDKRRFNLT